MRKMINVIKIILIFLVIFFTCNNVNAASITLEQIVEKFNNSSIVADYKNLGANINATNDANSINVELTINEKTENIEFLFENNILSVEIDSEKDYAFSRGYIALNLIDVIGQLHGYKEAELARTITSDECSNYTLEKEGCEAETISATKLKIKVDITKKIPLLDFSNTYFEVSDLENLKEYIYGDGSARKTKGNIWFDKSGYDGEYTLLVSEIGTLTQNTYKSVLSILEVMFDDNEVVEYFKNNYPGISSGDKEFIGFSIKVNPTDKTEWEEFLIPSIENREFVRICIDKSLAISAATGTNKVENKIDLDTLPRTGEETNVFLIVLYIIVTACSVGLVALLLVKRKRK